MDIGKKHIFISYAWEDEVFAFWLARSLTREGFYVWIDRLKLLGGEPFPVEIEDAIRDGTHRFLALMSRSSKEKPSPRKERSIAGKVSKASRISDFMIPLLVDDLPADELDFATTDLTAIEFRKNWADGLRALVKCLKASNAPQNQDAGLQRLNSSLREEIECQGGAETLRSNLLPILEIPPAIRKYEIIDNKLKDDLSNHWAYYRRENDYWAFTPPPAELPVITKELDSIDWKKHQKIDGIIPLNIVKSLLWKELNAYCRRLQLQEAGPERRLYFPIGLLPKNKIKFIGMDEKSTTVLVAGVRTSSWTNGVPNKFRYSLAPRFNVFLDRFDTPLVSLTIGVYVSDLNGQPFEGKTVLRRRKKVVTSWYNNHWANRLLGIVSWLGQGSNDIAIVKTLEGSFRISTTPLTFTCPSGIDETKLGKPEVIDPFEDDEPVESSSEAGAAQ